MASENANSKKLEKLNYILYFAITLLVVALGFYFYNFNNGLSDDSSTWGTFGDFMGGTLNPIFALFSLFAIIYTIKIQTQELELSRKELEATKEELEKSRIAQEEQSESLKLQNQATKLQIFENIFFQLNNLFLSMKKSLKGFSSDIFTRGNEIYGNDVLKEYLHRYKKDSIYDIFYSKYENELGIYFSQIYQILKVVNDNYLEKKLDNPKRYTNIFRAQFTKDELEFLFYHCLGTIGQRRFKQLVEDYEFFEHISLNADIEKQLLEYDIKAFGKNEKILQKYNELKDKTLTKP